MMDLLNNKIWNMTPNENISDIGLHFKEKSLKLII
jgi:hypothetical protein